MVEEKELKYDYLLQRKKGQEWEDMCMGNDLRALESLHTEKGNQKQVQDSGEKECIGHATSVGRFMG